MSEMKIKPPVLVVILGIAYAGYQYYDFRTTQIPAFESQKTELQSRLEQKRLDLKRLQDFAQNIEAIKTELRELNLQLEAALEHMPRSFNMSGLLRKLTMLAQNSGLELSTFKPALTEEKVDGAFYSSTTISFDLKGSFVQTLVFLDQVSRLKRILNVEELKINPDGNRTKTGPIAVATVAKVRTYRFSE